MQNYGNNMIQVYFVEIANEILSDRYANLLDIVSKDKREKIEKYRYDIDKKLSLYSELLVRYMACRILNANNQKLTFSTNKYGKPFLIGYPEFQYNISHTRNAIAVGISNKNIGVDIENIKMFVYAPDLVKKIFTVNEINKILSSADINKCFCEHWTKKEAYLKYSGTGLSTPLKSFNVLDDSLKSKTTTLEQNGYVISVYCDDMVSEINAETFTEQEILSLFSEIG